MSRILLSAHACGPEGQYVPNSKEAALALKNTHVDDVEFDVRLTMDGKFVVVHNDMLSGKDGHKYHVNELSLEAIQNLSEDVYTLEEMLNIIKPLAKAHIDIKDPVGEIEVCDLCEAVLGPEGFIITTTEDPSIAKIRAQRPHVSVALSLGKNLAKKNKLRVITVRLSELFPARRIKRCNPTLIAVNYKIGRLGVTRWAYRNKLPVLLWTIDTPKQIKRAWENKHIWAFTTNYPRRAMSILKQTDAENN